MEIEDPPVVVLGPQEIGSLAADPLGRVVASVWWQPAYLPDFNPIEKLWSKIKSWLRRAMAGTSDDLVTATDDAFRAVTPSVCTNYFKACGYEM